MNVQQDSSLDVNKALQIAKQASSDNRELVSHPLKKKQSIITDTNVSINSRDNNPMGRYKHGDIVVGADGIGGVVIDREKKLREMVDWDTTLQSVMALGDQNDALFDRMSLTSIDEKPTKEDPAIEYIKANPNSEAALKLLDVKKSFRNYDVTPIGLANVGDVKIQKMKEAMELVRQGIVKLPTVEQYEQQQLELKKQQREALQKSKELPPLPHNSSTETELQQSPSIENTEEPTMNTEQQKEIMSNANMDAFDIASKINPDKGQEPKMVEPQRPINLAMLENALRDQNPEEDAKNVASERTQTEEELQKKNEPMTIEVPESRADTFMEHMSSSLKEKMEVSKKINIKFTKDLILPRATRQIVSVDSYRKVAPRNVRGDIQAQPLINSGYIGYFKPCGSLKWNNLIPENFGEDEEEDVSLDIGKVAQFCFEQLQTTSIGQLSKVQFMQHTSAADIPDMLYAIMKASLPDHQEVTMVCGNKSCQGGFEYNYSIAELPDFELLGDDAITMIRELQYSMQILEDAEDTHKASPVMTQFKYTASSTDTIFVFKHRDIGTVVDRSPVLETLAETYGFSASVLSMYITDVYIKMRDTGNYDEDYDRSTDPSVICEELLRLSSENLDEIREIVQNIPSIETFSYSIKGDCVCPHCNNLTRNPKQDITTLVFQVALKARFFV